VRRAARAAFPPIAESSRNSAPEQIESNELHSASLLEILAVFTASAEFISTSIPQPAQLSLALLFSGPPSTIKLPPTLRTHFFSADACSLPNILLLFLVPALVGFALTG
jgi:hypothetical protein